MHLKPRGSCLSRYICCMVHPSYTDSARALQNCDKPQSTNVTSKVVNTTTIVVQNLYDDARSAYETSSQSCKPCVIAVLWYRRMPVALDVAVTLATCALFRNLLSIKCAIYEESCEWQTERRRRPPWKASALTLGCRRTGTTQASKPTTFRLANALCKVDKWNYRSCVTSFTQILSKIRRSRHKLHLHTEVRNTGMFRFSIKQMPVAKWNITVTTTLVTITTHRSNDSNTSIITIPNQETAASVVDITMNNKNLIRHINMLCQI